MSYYFLKDNEVKSLDIKGHPNKSLSPYFEDNGESLPFYDYVISDSILPGSPNDPYFSTGLSINNQQIYAVSFVVEGKRTNPKCRGIWINRPGYNENIYITGDTLEYHDIRTPEIRMEIGFLEDNTIYDFVGWLLNRFDADEILLPSVSSTNYNGTIDSSYYYTQKINLRKDQYPTSNTINTSVLYCDGITLNLKSGVTFTKNITLQKGRGITFLIPISTTSSNISFNFSLVPEIPSLRDKFYISTPLILDISGQVGDGIFKSRYGINQVCKIEVFLDSDISYARADATLSYQQTTGSDINNTIPFIKYKSI